MLAEGSLDSEDPCGYVIEIIGVVEKFNRICVRIFIFISLQALDIHDHLIGTVILSLKGTNWRFHTQSCLQRTR